MPGFEYRVPSQFVLTAAGAGQAIAVVPGVPSLAYFIAGIDIQLIGPSAVAVASVIGAPTVYGGLGFHVQQGPAMPYVVESYSPPQICTTGATVGLFMPTPPVAGGTWNAHIYGFIAPPPPNG